jgi:hypothetical protein
MWRERVAHLYSKYMATAAAERPNQQISKGARVDNARQIALARRRGDE